MVRFLVVLLVMCLVAGETHAIDSVAELLKKVAKEQEKQAKKEDKAASFKLVSGERVDCVWLAHCGDVYRDCVLMESWWRRQRTQ